MAKRQDATVGDYLDALEHAGAKTSDEVADCLGLSPERAKCSLDFLVSLKLVHRDQGLYYKQEKLGE